MADQILTSLTVDIAAAYLSKNTIAASDVPMVIRTIYGAIANLGNVQQSAPVERPAPAVPIKKSVMPDYIVCLEDGKKLKMLKRYLRSAYNMTPDEYRARWGLPADYPMTAPNYAAQRSEFAKAIGLGRHSVGRSAGKKR